MEGIRRCSECGKIMYDGYIINGGEEYYCSNDCLHKHYTEEEWREMYGEDNYWTEWEYPKIDFESFKIYLKEKYPENMDLYIKLMEDYIENWQDYYEM